MARTMAHTPPPPRTHADSKTGGGTRRELAICGAIFFLALVVRFAYLYESSGNPTFRSPIVDARTYDETARSFLGGKGFTAGFFWQPFFYPFFLSLAYGVSGESVLFAKLVQLMVGAVTCVLTYRLGRRVFGPTAGAIGAVAATLCGPLVFLEAELVGEGWAAFWSVVLLLLFLNARGRTGLRHELLLGACGALATLSRPTFLPFLLAGVAWLAVDAWQKYATRRRILPRLLAGTAGFLVIVAPVAVLAHRTTGTLTFLPTSGGLNLYIGNNPEMCATLNARPGTEYERLLTLPERSGIRDAAKKEAYFRKLVRDFAVNQPRLFCKGLAVKTAHFFSSREIPRNHSIYVFRPYSTVLSVLVWRAGPFGFPFGILLPLAVLGIVCRRRDVAAPLAIFAVVYPLSVILVFASGRYRVPMAPAVCVLAGAGAAWLFETLRSRRRVRFGLSAACAGAMAVAISWPGPFCMETLNYEAELHYALGGNAWKRDGKLEEAVRQYQQALDLQPGYADAHLNLGAVLARMGKLPESITEYEQALERRPDDPNAHTGLGLALAQGGHLQEAIRHYEEAVRIDPMCIDARNNLANVLSDLGNHAAAITQFHAILQLRPDDAPAHNGLGTVFLQQGRVVEAAAQFHEALRSDPEFAEACNNLGLVMVRQGDLDAAIRHFREAVRIRPNYADAHSNAGLMLARQNRLDEAMDHYAQALSAQPGFLNARLGLADALMNQGRTGDANALYRETVQMYPQAPLVHLMFGTAMERQGMIDAAIEQYRETVRLAPDHAEAKARLEAALQKRNAGATQ